jgi:hypothetical protein
MSNTATKTKKPATNAAATYVDPEARLGALCYDLAQLEDRIAPLEDERQAIRAEISTIIEAIGPQELEGFGKLEITAAAKVISYDRQKIDALIMALIDEGTPELAERIRTAKKESARSGSLRISRIKD